MINQAGGFGARSGVDTTTDIIRVHGAAFWQPDALDTVLDLLSTHITRAHAHGLSAAVLVNLTGAGPQLAETIGRMQAKASTMYLPMDRLAVVLGSSLLRRQVARVERAADCHVFATVPEAEAWLRSARPDTAVRGAGHAPARTT